jgi:hypothetical protein
MTGFDPLRTHDSFAFAGHPMFIGSADRFTPQGFCVVDPARADIPILPP